QRAGRTVDRDGGGVRAAGAVRMRSLLAGTRSAVAEQPGERMVAAAEVVTVERVRSGGEGDSLTGRAGNGVDVRATAGAGAERGEHRSFGDLRAGRRVAVVAATSSRRTDDHREGVRQRRAVDRDLERSRVRAVAGIRVIGDLRGRGTAVAERPEILIAIRVEVVRQTRRGEPDRLIRGAVAADHAVAAAGVLHSDVTLAR